MSFVRAFIMLLKLKFCSSIIFYVSTDNIHVGSKNYNSFLLLTQESYLYTYRVPQFDKIIITNNAYCYIKLPGLHQKKRSGLNL